MVSLSAPLAVAGLLLHGLSGVSSRTISFKPPGLLKGTFSADVAAKVAAFHNEHRPGGGGGGSSGGGGSCGGSGGGSGGSNASGPTSGWGTFNQLLDHSNPHLGTFSQRYWWGTQYWNGPGSPVIVVNPGEQSATGFNTTYLTNQRITGLFAESVGGAVIILEHRYWGESSPYPDLTVEHLQYLTLDNSLRDMAHFAENLVLPFDPSGRSAPTCAPWVLTGGSYPGALAAWSANLDAQYPESHGGVSPFWAYYATSATVETIGDFWQYFALVQEIAPANCSADLVAISGYVDNVLQHGTSTQKHNLKAPFLLENLSDADFAKALSLGPLELQKQQFYLEPTYGVSPFYQLCDYVENVWPGSNATVPGSNGVGVTKALAGYAKWFTENLLPKTCEASGYGFQGTLNADCLQFSNASNPINTDLSVSNWWNRQYWWLQCNEPLGWFQDAPPQGGSTPSIVSRLVDYSYNLGLCAVLFPSATGGFGLQGNNRTPTGTDAYTGGWSVSPSRTPRLMYANGQNDPWRAATVSSPWRPGGPLTSTAKVSVHIVPNGGHCSDLYGENWAVNPAVKAIADAEAATLLGWVNEFYHEKGIKKPT